MAMGTVYSTNSTSNEKYSPTTFSKYSMGNPNSTVDQTKIDFNFWKGMLKIIITPRKHTNDDTVAYDYPNQIAIHLTYSKAGILRKEIIEFMKPENKYKSRGVATPKGCIYICDGSELNCKNPCLVIKLIDSEGAVLSSIAYEFNTTYHFAIRNYDSDSKKYDLAIDEYATREIEELIMILGEFEKAASCAVASTVVDSMHYSVDRINNNLYAVAEKLGVDLGKKSSGGNYSSKSSFFNTSSGMNAVGGNAAAKTTAQYSSYEDLEFED
ncbi:MAG: hypothetical protein J6Y02_10065 [Pseudobutyrivibrio sp.]|nr:hypothetical protein [Pseudobutyrivibrio sp.]